MTVHAGGGGQNDHVDAFPTTGATPAALALPAGTVAATRHHRAEMAFRAFLETLGLDLDDVHLADTPTRVAKMYLDELFNPQPFTFTTFPAESHNLVVLTDIPFTSLCAHHFLPFIGVAHVGYIPSRDMVGLSKLARTVRYFARGPQVQERLTQQVTTFLEDKLDPVGLGVVLEAEHHCMTVRGVQTAGVTTVTSSLRGLLKDDGPARAEFLALTNR